MNVKIFSPSVQVVLDSIDDKSYRYRTIMGQHNVTVYVSRADALRISLGSYLDFQGIRYTLERPENIKKNNTRNLDYTIIFESPQAKLSKYKIRNTVDKRLKFPYTARPKEHLQLIVDNLNMRDSGWTIGECIDAVESVVSYNHTFCSDALQMVADAFKTEWEVKNKVIHLKKVESNKNNPLALSYGRGNGFKTGMTRTNVDSSKPVEVLYIQGGERNIDYSKYGSNELLLPKNQTIGFDGVYFEDQEGFNPDNARYYKTDADGYYITRADKELKTHEEDSLDCSNIYPSRVGTITKFQVDDKGNYDIFDTTIPEALDFSKYRIDGEKMTVIFQDKMLVSKEFDIMQTDSRVTGYVHAQRKFMLVSQEYDGQTMPNNIYSPQIGGKYAVFGMMLPDEYICDNATKTGASWDMFREGIKCFFENEEPKFAFTGELNGIWAKSDWLNIGGQIVLGGYVSFTDNQMIDEEENESDSVLIRITGVKDYLNDPYTPEITLANVTAATYNSEFRKIEENEVVAETQNKNTVNFVKRSWRGMMELVNNIYDPSGSFQEDIVSAIALRSMMLALGDPLLQYVFMNEDWQTEVEPVLVYNKEEHWIECSASNIRHMTLGIDTVQPNRSETDYLHWIVPTYNSAVLTDFPEQFYYLYLRVSKSYITTEDGLKIGTGEYFISPEKVEFDSETNNYILLVAFINSEEDGNRLITNLFGFAELTPGMLRINNITSNDGQSYLKLLANQFKFGNGDNSIDWNVTEDSTLSLTNVVVRNALKVAGSALIAGFNFYNDRIDSVKTVTYNNNEYPALRIIGNESQAIITLRSVVTKWTESHGTTDVLQTITLDSSNGEISSRTTDGDVCTIDSQGILANRAGTDTLPASTGISMKAAVAALGYGKMDKTAWGSEWGIVGVYGTASNSSSNPAPAYGGWFNVLMARGLMLGCRQIDNSTGEDIILTNTDTFISCYNSSILFISLPVNPYNGHVIFIRKNNSATVTVVGNGKLILNTRTTSSINVGESQGDTGIFTFDGQYWLYNYLPRKP